MSSCLSGNATGVSGSGQYGMTSLIFSAPSVVGVHVRPVVGSRSPETVCTGLIVDVADRVGTDGIWVDRDWLIGSVCFRLEAR